LVTVISVEADKKCSEKPCINLCCPKGFVIKDDPKSLLEKHHRCDPKPSVKRTCQQHQGNLTWNGDLWDGDDRTGFAKSGNFFGSSFQCSDNKDLVGSNELFGRHELRLQLNGNHQFIFETSKGEQIETLNSSDFCLSFNSDDEGSIAPLFVVCHGFVVEEAEQFTNIFYPVLIFISCFFTLLTLVVYLALEDLRCTLFGKLVIGFLFNVCINYFFNGIHYYLDNQDTRDYLNTKFCIFLGYITHHSFISFFFWMNAMAVNITYKFSNLLTTHVEEKHEKSILSFLMYAQGLPLLITLAIGIIDIYGSCDSVIPNIGRYSCFLGSPYEKDQLFIQTADFFYFYLIIMIIVISNTVCFLITGYFLTINWSTVRRMQTSNRDDKLLSHVVLVAKLSFIMGIPWTLDVISAAIGHTQGHSKTIWSRLLLDILNLLSGVLIFIILVCKNSVWIKLKRKLGGPSALTFTETYQLNT